MYYCQSVTYCVVKTEGVIWCLWASSSVAQLVSLRQDANRCFWWYHYLLRRNCYVECGVSWGSILGPLLFALYSANVIQIAAIHGISVHAYADGLQTYVSCAASGQCVLPPTAFWRVPPTLTSDDV